MTPSKAEVLMVEPELVRQIRGLAAQGADPNKCCTGSAIVSEGNRKRLGSRVCFEPKLAHGAFPIKTSDNSSRIVGSGLISLERTFSRGRQDQTMSALRTEAPYPRDVSVQLDLRHSRTERQDQPS